MKGGQISDKIQAEMAAELGADSLRYLPVESIARAITFDSDQLCQACITGEYPTKAGQELYQIALAKAGTASKERTYERRIVGAGSRQ